MNGAMEATTQDKGVVLTCMDIILLFLTLPQLQYICFCEHLV